MSMTPEKAAGVAENYTKPWCSHDPEAVASFFAGDGRIVINDGEPSEGATAIAQMASGFNCELPGLVVRMDDVRCSATHAVRA